MKYRVKCNDCQLSVINGHPCHESGCRGVTLYETRGKAFVKYRVWSLDVWGSAREGFEVNDRSECGSIMVPVDADDKRIIRELKKAGKLNKRCRFASFSIDGDESLLMVDAAKTSEPIYQLEIA